MRKSYLLGLGAVAGITALGIFFVARKSPSVTENSVVAELREDPAPPIVTEPPAQQAGVNTQTEPEQTTAAAPEIKVSKQGPLRIPKGQPIPELFPYEKERGEISDLAANPGPTSLDALAKYLKHSDAMVREEARLGLVRMSSPDAVAILRKAADSASTSQEAKDLRESANFLALATGLESAESPF